MLTIVIHILLTYDFITQFSKGSLMNNTKFIEIEVPNYFCPDCLSKDRITEIAIKELIIQD